MQQRTPLVAHVDHQPGLETGRVDEARVEGGAHGWPGVCPGVLEAGKVRARAAAPGMAFAPACSCT